MLVRDKINYILEEKGMSKREFAKQLLSLEPTLTATGKPPSESTVYGYLNGRREIKIELIPYIAEVLEVKEQELFEMGIEHATQFNYTLSKEVRDIVALLQYVPSAKILELKEQLLKYKQLHEEQMLKN
jgi:transcriptional regulator with XRE-family HTH domain